MHTDDKAPYMYKYSHLLGYKKAFVDKFTTGLPLRRNIREMSFLDTTIHGEYLLKYQQDSRIHRHRFQYQQAIHNFQHAVGKYQICQSRQQQQVSHRHSQCWNTLWHSCCNSSNKPTCCFNRRCRRPCRTTLPKARSQQLPATQHKSHRKQRYKWQLHRLQHR